MDDTEDYDDTSDYNPLFFAVHNGNLNLARTLFNKYSSEQVIRGRTLMHVAAARGHEQIIDLLDNKKDKDGNSPLHLAIKGNHFGVFTRLLEENNVNTKNFKDERPLHFATLNNRMEFVKILLENGASVDVKNDRGLTPLDLAVNCGNIQMVEILIKNGASVKTPKLLVSAAYSGNLEMVKLLMANGCKNVDFSLFDAVRNGHLEVVKYLMTNGLKSKIIIDQDLFDLLGICVKCDHLDILKYLINIGVKSKRNLCVDSILWSHHDCWKYLSKCTSEYNATTYSVENQLHYAVRMGRVETVKIIVNDHKCDSLVSKLAVHIAVETGNEEILKILLKAEYSFESCFKDTSPLHVAATFENTKLAELLLNAGADVNLQTENKYTPLHFAATAGEAEMVKYLLKSGADPLLSCEYGEPLSLALNMFSPFVDYPSVVSSPTFEKLVKIVEMLCPGIKKSNFEQIFGKAARINVASEIEESPRLKLEETNEFENTFTGIFRPELVRCLFNHLKDHEIEYHLESLINDSENFSSQLLDVIFEYSEANFETTIHLWKRDYKSNLRLINYIQSVDSLINVEIEHHLSDYKKHDEDSIVFLKLIVARLILLTDESHAETLKFCAEHNLKEWGEECEKEKTNMRDMKILQEFKMSFLDILTKPVDLIAKYLKNENFLKTLESSFMMFPAYAEFLKINVDNGIRRKDLINECVNSLCDVIKRNHKILISISNVCQIFQYLSVIDLRRFSAAFS